MNPLYGMAIIRPELAARLIDVTTVGGPREFIEVPAGYHIIPGGRVAPQRCSYCGCKVLSNTMNCEKCGGPT